MSVIPQQQIGEKIFTQEDQQFFAALSGDSNPMHLDAVYARKIFDGKPVVHGMHLLLWALEFCLRRHALALVALRGDFSQPVFVGDRVQFFEEVLADGTRVLRVAVNDMNCARFRLQSTDVTASAASAGAGHSVADNSFVDNSFVDKVSPFGAVHKSLGPEIPAALCAISRYVGMVCPGLHSLLATLELKFAAVPTSAATRFAVAHYDERFRMYTLAVEGPCSGTVRAMDRKPPPLQASVQQLAMQVNPQEFAGTRSLVIGGSRGLGAWTARALVAGGGAVIITYAQGHREAQDLCDELNHFRAGTCQLRHWEVQEAPANFLSTAELTSLSHIYFYATPRIFRRRSAAFKQSLYEEFVACYVTALQRLLDWVEANSQRPVTVFAPSSVAVEDTPAELQEYAAAKRRMEEAVAQINRACHRVRVLTARLPRLDTDQTSALAEAATASMDEVMWPLLRAVQRGDLPQREAAPA